ncbi:WAP-type (Whey Acidic Protein) 'four-disulfide core' [Nesidiocoris tenuis]|uniref:WAP-type (Whey Acidic Protein) 'four-disulfide core n=1 Tax=Nesidiocoris tenuis TaxID=355587 RepID=A0ABN7AHZ4_9HEMI|nr:WAP-type (Whey Acidic Protein) 'four-disulfide core' [Nesidiocoris tenuis]
MQIKLKHFPQRRTFFKLRNLEVGVQYFLQVEAQSLCGKKRLIGSKAGKVLNVTDLSSSNFTKPLPEKFLREKTHLNVWVSKVSNNTAGSLTAKVSWTSRPNVKYVVAWRENETTDGMLDNYVVQTASNIELSALHYKKTYTVKITEKAKGKKGARRTGKIVFVADPQCNKVKRNEC